MNASEKRPKRSVDHVNIYVHRLIFSLFCSSPNLSSDNQMPMVSVSSNNATVSTHVGIQAAARKNALTCCEAFSTHLRDELKQGNADDQKQASESNSLLFFSYFDEAHDMTKDGHPRERPSSYYVLGSVLANMKSSPMFFFFLSTNFGIVGLPPSHPSLPGWQNTTHAPFTELPFDIFAYHLYDELKEKNGLKGVTFADICNISYIVKFGRPL